MNEEKDLKFAHNDNFDFEILDSENNLLFKIDTSKGYEFVMLPVKRVNESALIVKDAIIDLKVFEDIMDGKYTDKNLNIKGISYVRDISTHIDEPCELVIKNAKLKSFALGRMGEGAAVVVLKFEAPMYQNGSHNITLNIREELN